MMVVWWRILIIVGLMQGDKGINVLSYPSYCQQDIQEFSRRLTVEQFRAVDVKRMKREFQTLQEGRITNYEKVAHSTEKHKDRYSNIHAYKHNRVQLEKVGDFYINASYMKSVLDGQLFAIFAQAPIQNTVEHFWAACYHHKVRKIVMLCAFQDPNRGQQAQKYWPEVGKVANYAKVGLKVACLEAKSEGADFTRTKIVLKGTEGDRQLEHIHWSGWGDMRKPLGELSEGLFRGLVEDCVRMADSKELFLIHCSAGIGRTGTLGTVVQALRCLRRQGKASVVQIVDNMRRHRMACVQTMEQYGFIYQQVRNML